MSCRAVKEISYIKRKGRPTIEWYKDGKPQYYCYGIIDLRNDELFPQCEECPKQVGKAQEDYDKYLESEGENE